MLCWQCSLIRKLDLYISALNNPLNPFDSFHEGLFSFFGVLSLDTAKYRAKSHQDLSSCS